MIAPLTATPARPETFIRDAADIHAPRRIRDEVAEVCLGWGVPGRNIEMIRLLTSEMVTNTLRVAAGGQIEARAALCPRCVVLDVWDPGDLGPLLSSCRALMPDPEELEESGRGLPLVEVLACLWYWRPSAGRAGKHLIVHVPLDAPCDCVKELP